MSQKLNNMSELHSSEATMLFTELAFEEEAEINGGFGFFKKIAKGFKSAVKAIGEGASHFILNETVKVYKNPWGFATGNDQRDPYDLDGWNRQ